MPFMTEELKYQLQLHENDDPLNQPISVRLVRRDKDWYLQVLLNIRETPVHTADRSKGVIGVDVNQGFLSVSETDAKGNLIATRDIFIPHMGVVRKKSLHELRCSVKEIVQEAGLKQKLVTIEGSRSDLEFQHLLQKTADRSDDLIIKDIQVPEVLRERYRTLLITYLELDDNLVKTRETEEFRDRLKSGFETVYETLGNFEDKKVVRNRKKREAEMQAMEMKLRQDDLLDSDFELSEE